MQCGHGVLYRPIPRQDVLYFPELDPEAAQLYLVVHPPEEYQVAVGQVLYQVPGPVEAVVGVVSERVLHEPLCGELGPVQVAPCHPRAPDVKLPGHAHGHPLPVDVKYVKARIGYGFAYGKNGGCPVFLLTVNTSAYSCF